MKKIDKSIFISKFENDIANIVLYNMCEEYSSLTDVNQVAAKSFLIGRSYAASPQRGVPRPVQNVYDFFTEYACIFIDEMGKHPFQINIDNKINTLKRIGLSDAESLYESIKLVIYFNDCSFEAIKNLKGKKNSISFASKMLHFHLPNRIFILDSYAMKFASMVCKGLDFTGTTKAIVSKLVEDGLYQDKYRDLIKHYVKCIHVRNSAGLNGYLLTPRDVDTYLLNEMF
jgi:hypothetical protein